MTPVPSVGVLLVPFDAQGVLYDPVGGQLHVLNPTARTIWECCVEGWSVDEMVDSLSSATGTDRDVVAAGVDAHLAELAEAGLVGSDEWQDPVSPVPPTGSMHRTNTSRVHQVIDAGAVFASDDPTVIAAIDLLLGPMAGDRPASVCYAVDGEPDGSHRLTGPGIGARFGSLEDLLDDLPTILNQVAATSSACVTLHSGAVVTPSGVVVLLPAVSGSGKTTLTAALVQHGWGYLTDEAIGVRAGSLEVVGYPKPLVLDGASRAALGLAPSGSPNVSVAELGGGAAVTGPVAPVGAVVLPRYRVGAEPTAVRLEPLEAFVSIAEHALNLRYVGSEGLDAIADLAHRVPCHRLEHGGGDAVLTAMEALANP